MTKFEEKIKREMSREKFLKIRDQPYGDGKNISKLTYGKVSSWLTWNRNENGEIARPPSSPVYTKRNSYYDGPLDWDQDKLIPIERRFSPRITTDIVFIGLNMSGDGTMPSGFPSFQNARGVKRIVETFFGTQAEGAYFTDIIKPDKRILEKLKEKEKKPANSTEFLKIVKKYNNILEEHIRLFIEELDFIGAVKPLLIVFGDGAYDVLKKGIDDNFLEKRFSAVVKIKHYAYRYITDEEYKSDTKEKLAEFITIPEKNEAL